MSSRRDSDQGVGMAVVMLVKKRSAALREMVTCMTAGVLCPCAKKELKKNNAGNECRGLPA